MSFAALLVFCLLTIGLMWRQDDCSKDDYPPLPDRVEGSVFLRVEPDVGSGSCSCDYEHHGLGPQHVREHDSNGGPMIDTTDSTSGEEQEHNHDSDIDLTTDDATSSDWAPTVLVLSPIKDAAGHMERFFDNLRTLDYPHSRLSLAMLESDSSDDTAGVVRRALPELRQEFRRVELFQRDFNYHIAHALRHKESSQFERRCVLARSRNYLLSRALQDEEWVLWIDSDLRSFPSDVIQQLLAADKNIIVPNCVLYWTPRNGPRTKITYDLNSFRHGKQSGSPLSQEEPVLFEGYGKTHNIYLDKLRDEGDVVPIDSVGGTMLLIKADLHREGLIFPPFVFRQRVETEGLAAMATAMGHGIFAMPNLEVFHL
jgi:hypothetical protein